MLLKNEAHISYGMVFVYAKYSDICIQEAFLEEKKKKKLEWKFFF